MKQDDENYTNMVEVVSNCSVCGGLLRNTVRKVSSWDGPFVAYVTVEPCPGCQADIKHSSYLKGLTGL